jgi:hypothetical protein
MATRNYLLSVMLWPRDRRHRSQCRSTLPMPPTLVGPKRTEMTLAHLIGVMQWSDDLAYLSREEPGLPMPHQYIAERDAKGRIVRSAAGSIEMLAAGRKFNWASPYRRMCAKCRRPAMRGSESCWVHDPEYRKRRAQRAIESGDPSRIAKVPQRKHRSIMAAL